MGSNEKNGPKGRCFYLFHLLLILINFFFVYLGFIHTIKQQGGFGRATMRKTGQRYLFF